MLELKGEVYLLSREGMTSVWAYINCGAPGILPRLRCPNEGKIPRSGLRLMIGTLMCSILDPQNRGLKTQAISVCR